jgi:archaellum component FlaC
VLEASAAAQRKDLEADYATHAGVVKQVEEARATLADLDRERKEIIESTSEVVRAEVTRYQEEAKGQIKAIHAEVDAAVAKRDEILAEIEALRAKLGA